MPRDKQKWCSPKCRFAAWKAGRDGKIAAPHQQREKAIRPHVDAIQEHLDAIRRLLDTP
jgi:hypothetical protein